MHLNTGSGTSMYKLYKDLISLKVICKPKRRLQHSCEYCVAARSPPPPSTNPPIHHHRHRCLSCSRWGGDGGGTTEAANGTTPVRKNAAYSADGLLDALVAFISANNCGPRDQFRRILHGLVEIPPPWEHWHILEYLPTWVVNDQRRRLSSIPDVHVRQISPAIADKVRTRRKLFMVWLFPTVGAPSPVSCRAQGDNIHTHLSPKPYHYTDDSHQFYPPEDKRF